MLYFFFNQQLSTVILLYYFLYFKILMNVLQRVHFLVYSSVLCIDFNFWILYIFNHC